MIKLSTNYFKKEGLFIMKKNTAYTIGSIIILLICAFCFVVLPAFTGNSTGQEKLPAFGKYNGKEIRYDQGTDFANYVSQYGQMYQNYGAQLDQQTYFYVFSNAFNSTVMKYAYKDFVKNSGYVVPKEAINRKMIPYFYDESGNYSSKLYKQAPENTKIELLQAIQDELETSRFYDDTFGSQTELLGTESFFGLKESDKEMDFLKEIGKLKRGFNMALFPISEYPEEEKLVFANSNAQKFNKFNLSVISADKETDLQNFVKRIENQEITFEDCVTEHSTKYYSDSTGKLTNTYQYQIELILDNKDDLIVLSNLKKDGLSSIIKTSNGYSVFKCNGDIEKPDFTSDETKRILTNYLNSYERTKLEDFFIAKATDFTNQALKSDFKTIATEQNIKNVEIPPFPLNYGSVEITDSLDTSIEGLTNADLNDTFLKTAFSLKKNEISVPFLLNNNIVVLQFTTEETNEEENLVNANDILSADQTSANNVIMGSKKLVNNFADVYFNNLMSN